MSIVAIYSLGLLFTGVFGSIIATYTERPLVRALLIVAGLAGPLALMGRMSLIRKPLSVLMVGLLLYRVVIILAESNAQAIGSTLIWLAGTLATVYIYAKGDG